MFFFFGFPGSFAGALEPLSLLPLRASGAVPGHGITSYEEGDVWSLFFFERFFFFFN